MAKTTKKTATKKTAAETTVVKGAPEQLVKAAGKAANVAATPKADKAPKAAKADDSILAIHINVAGRVCFGRAAAARIACLGHMLMTAEGNQVRMVAKKEATENTVEIRYANGRPYVSATGFLKPLGFDGTKPLDIEAAPYNSHGFEFKVT